jgi:hypothetical protein
MANQQPQQGQRDAQQPKAAGTKASTSGQKDWQRQKSDSSKSTPATDKRPMNDDDIEMDADIDSDDEINRR